MSECAYGGIKISWILAPYHTPHHDRGRAAPRQDLSHYTAARLLSVYVSGGGKRRDINVLHYLYDSDFVVSLGSNVTASRDSCCVAAVV